jgi:glycosyltransferase involved in cell wall biosynthesis
MLLLTLVAALQLVQAVIHVSVEGWRGLPHSYAIVNQFQLLEMVKHPKLFITVEDQPLLRSYWKPATGMFTDDQEAALAAIPLTNSTESKPDVVFRITWPFRLSPAQNLAPNGVTWVFGTTEIKSCIDEMVAPANPPWDRVAVQLATPSQWSKAGFLNSGVPAANVHVVAHGFDPVIYKPATDQERTRLREKMGWAGRYVFLSVGSKVGAKGIPDVLRSFVRIHGQNPKAKLVLKVAASVYNESRTALEQAGGGAGAELLRSGAIEYRGETLPFSGMAELYQATDAYVSAYRGEGFNIPVLEAAACGALLVVTKGGPTDDFVTDDFALRVHASETAMGRGRGGKGRGKQQIAGGRGKWLVPDPEHLDAQMLRAMMDEELAVSARAKGPVYVRSRFTWTHAVDELTTHFQASIDDAAKAAKAAKAAGGGEGEGTRPRGRGGRKPRASEPEESCLM